MFGREGTFEADPALEAGAAALFAPLAGQRPSENAMREGRQRMFAALAAAGPATARGSLFGRVAAVSASIIAPLAAVSAVGAMIDNEPMQAPVNAIRSVAEFVGVGGASNDDAATGGAKDPGPSATAAGGDVRQEDRDDGTPEASPSATADNDGDNDDDGDSSNSGPGGSSSNSGPGSANSGSSDDDDGDGDSNSGSSGDDSGSGSNSGSGPNSGSGSDGSGSNSGSGSDGSGSSSGSGDDSSDGSGSDSSDDDGDSDSDDDSDDQTSGTFGGSTATGAQTPTSLRPFGGDSSRGGGDR